MSPFWIAVNKALVTVGYIFDPWDDYETFDEAMTHLESLEKEQDNE